MLFLLTLSGRKVFVFLYLPNRYVSLHTVMIELKHFTQYYGKPVYPEPFFATLQTNAVNGCCSSMPVREDTEPGQ